MEQILYTKVYGERYLPDHDFVTCGKLLTSFLDKIFVKILLCRIFLSRKEWYPFLKKSTEIVY